MCTKIDNTYFCHMVNRNWIFLLAYGVNTYRQFSIFRNISPRNHKVLSCLKANNFDLFLKNVESTSRMQSFVLSNMAVSPGVDDSRVFRRRVEAVYVLPLEAVPGPGLPGRLLFGPISLQLHLAAPGSLAARYGPLVRLPGPTLLASHPRHIQRLLAASRPDKSALPTMEAKRKDTLPVRMPEYETDFSHLATQYNGQLDFKPDHFNSIIEEASNNLIERMNYLINLQNEVPCFKDELYKWSLQCTFGCLFSKDFGFLEDTSLMNEHDIRISGAVQIFSTFKEASRCLVEAEAGPLGKIFKKRTFEDDIDVLHGVLCRHLRVKYLSLSRDPPSKLGLVEKMVLKEKMSANDILNMILETVVLGVNIVAHSVGFIIYHLSKYPGCQGKLFDEVSTFHLSNLQELPYLNCCIAESMRLRPPFSYLSRDLDDDVIIHGYGIPRGTQVYLANEIANMREELFPRPNEYSPERWELKSGRPLSYEYHLLPMKRIAPLLQSQIAILTAKLTQKFKFEYHYGTIGSGGRALATPNKPFSFTFIDRKH